MEVAVQRPGPVPISAPGWWRVPGTRPTGGLPFLGPLLIARHSAPTEVCLKDPMSVADSLYNLQLVQDFCASRLPRGCPLSLEDLLYVPPPLKVRPLWACGPVGIQDRGPWAHPAFRFQVNLVVLLAEMFMCFEVLKPDFVQAKDLPDGHGEAWPGVQVGVGAELGLTLLSLLQPRPPRPPRPPPLRTAAAVGTLFPRVRVRTWRCSSRLVTGTGSGMLCCARER